jgi:hypothetical protein
VYLWCVWTLHLDNLTTNTPYLPAQVFPISQEIIVSHRNYRIETQSHTSPIIPPRTKVEGRATANSELGVSPFTGSPPFLSPVEVADAVLPEPEKDAAGAEVLILPEDAMALIMVPVPVAMPGNGARDGAEKLPKSLGSPMLLGILPISERRGGDIHTIGFGVDVYVVRG